MLAGENFFSFPVRLARQEPPSSSPSFGLAGVDMPCPSLGQFPPSPLSPAFAPPTCATLFELVAVLDGSRGAR